MSDLEDARIRWIGERAQHERFAELIGSRIRDAISNVGIWSDVQFRAKEVDSLIKKLMKGRHTYESLPDKVGVRIVVRYRADVQAATVALLTKLHCGLLDPKIPATNQVGYLSSHIDTVRLADDDLEAATFLPTQFWAEVQIRTQAQHLWSEMSHDSFYKNDATINVLSDDVKRRVNLMAGQIEIADREFDRLSRELPPKPEGELFAFLEPYYYRLTSKRPDTELSLDVLRVLLPTFGADLIATKVKLAAFFDEHRQFLEERYRQVQQGEVPSSPLFFQPEAIVIYERLTDDQLRLRKAWNGSFAEPLLESLANDFGLSFD